MWRIVALTLLVAILAIGLLVVYRDEAATSELGEDPAVLIVNGRAGETPGAVSAPSTASSDMMVSSSDGDLPGPTASQLLADLWQSPIAPKAGVEADPNDPAILHARFEKEKRDPIWADQAEKSLRQTYERLPYVGNPRNRFDVSCRTTLCEFTGVIDQKTAPSAAYGNEAVRAFTQANLDLAGKDGSYADGGTITVVTNRNFPGSLGLTSYLRRKGD